MQAGADKSAANQRPSDEIFDTRGMQSPENVLSVLKRASALASGQTLKILADCNPWQMYDLLQQRGYFLEMERQQDGSYLGTVRERELDKLRC